MPLAALVELVARTRPVFVGLSFALAERLPNVRAAIAILRREAPNTRLLLGGRGAGIDGTPAPDLGVDAVARCGTSAAEVIRAWKQ